MRIKSKWLHYRRRRTEIDTTDYGLTRVAFTKSLSVPTKFVFLSFWKLKNALDENGTCNFNKPYVSVKTAISPNCELESLHFLVNERLLWTRSKVSLLLGHYPIYHRWSLLVVSALQFRTILKVCCSSKLENLPFWKQRHTKYLPYHLSHCWA